MEEKDQQELQEKILIYQIMQKQAEELGQQVMLVDRRYAELELALQAISDTEKLEKDNEILVSLGGGVFSPGKITGKKLLMELGAGIFAERGSEEAKKLLEEKKQELEKVAKELQAEIGSISAGISSLALEIERISQEPAARKGKPKG